ncbi:hypothetical protein FQR65_LT00688 [Abscondita terminalis]|nr:hypothetical protein FQR65_LT00688 [Abscondita terminalis]
MNLYAVVLFVITVTFCTVHTGAPPKLQRIFLFLDATVCAPFSTFKIDCDECQCSQNGREYSCRPGKCDPATFLKKNNQNQISDNSIPGQVYPREADVDVAPQYLNDEVASSEEVNRDGRDGAELSNQYARDAGEVVPPYPYLNDEIPSSQEVNRVARDYVVVDGGQPSNQYARDADEIVPYVSDEDSRIGRDYVVVDGGQPSNLYERDADEIVPYDEDNRIGRDYVVMEGGQPSYQYARDADEIVPYVSDEDSRIGRDYVVVDGGQPNNLYERDADVIVPYDEDNRVARDYVVVDNVDGNGGGPNYQYRRDADDVAYIVPQNYRRRRDLSFNF